MILYPTRHCFDDAIELCEHWAREDPDTALSLVVVHGIVLVPDSQPADASDIAPGTRSVHAWVETPAGLVFDAGLNEAGERFVFSVEKADYYAHYRVQETTRYTMPEVLAANRASGHYGPWKPEYQALCRKRETR